MLIKRPKSWELKENQATDEKFYRNRRRILLGLGATAAIGGGFALTRGGGMPEAEAKVAVAAEPGLAGDLYPVARNEAFQSPDRPLTDPELATTYNNFYEFGSHKQISQAAQALKLRPWEVVIDGLVEQPITLDADELIRKMPLEERIYRHRCVEAWSMVVPWSGFPLRALVDMARPLGDAKFVKMTTFEDSAMAPGQRQFWYPWPYVEGLTIEEATHDLAFIATGIYGEPMPRQNGAPLRLAVPWKYGFKSVKSIVRFEFTAERPVSFWEEIQGSEYGFWANVNPEVPHPRWSQATERPLGVDGRIPTLYLNGYADEIGDLYAGLEGENLYM